MDKDTKDLVDRLTTENAIRIGEEITNKQKEKVETLLHKEHPEQISVDKFRVVINLACIELSDKASEVLAKSLNFAIVAKRRNY